MKNIYTFSERLKIAKKRFLEMKANGSNINLLREWSKKNLEDLKKVLS